MRIRFLFGLTALLALTACAPSKTETAPAPSAAPTDAKAVVDGYRQWVLSESDALLKGTTDFTAAVQAGDREKAKSLYADARAHYERIEPIAEALGDLDPRIDARKDDVTNPADWRGYHKIEQILWSTADIKTAAPFAKTLLDDVKLLRAQIESADITVAKLVTGAVELLNEVSKTKVTGVEEAYSHTDLWDFQANVDGSAEIWQLLSTEAKTKDAELSKTIDEKLTALNALLATHKKGEGFKLYGELKPDEIKALSAAVDALAEPLSKLGSVFPSDK
jgi:iron uptake system component EfeO